MSDFGLFEAASDDEQAPRRKQRIAARQMSAALADITAKFGPFTSNADGVDAFEDRWGVIRKDARKVLLAHGIGTYPAVMREVHGCLKGIWAERSSRRQADIGGSAGQSGSIAEPASSAPLGSNPSLGDTYNSTLGPSSGPKTPDNIGQMIMPGVGGGPGSAPPMGSGMGPVSQTDLAGHAASRRRAAYPDDDPRDEEELNKEQDRQLNRTKDEFSSDKHSRRLHAEDRDAPIQDIQETFSPSGGNLVPDPSFDRYLDEVDQGGPQAVDGNDFAPGGDSGSDGHREARQLVADLYVDWAQSNRLRHASMNTLDLYASTGLHDADYYLLAGLIRQAECDCDDDKDDDGHDESGSSESSDGDDDADGDDEDSGSDDPDSGDNPFADDEGDSGGDDDGDDGSDFGAEDAPADDAEDTGDDVPPSDAGSDFGGEEDGDDEGGPDGFGEDPAQAGPPGSDVGGQSFTVPEQAPDLPPEAMDQIPPDDSQGDQAVPPEVVDQILGLPPGTIEQLIMEELSGGGDQGPPQGQGGPPPQLARRRQRWAAEDPTQAADPAAAAQPQAPAQMPAAPPAGGGSAGTMAPPGAAGVAPPPPAMPLENQPKEDALLDTAVQSVTQMIDQETQEYQQMIDPLTQALQAIEFAQQVETAENPLDVTPPEGTTDVDPSAAPGGAQSLQQQAFRIARRYNLSEVGYSMLVEAMSRKHYEHVGEAIRTLPPELRPGIADHIGKMFGEDNARFNHGKWLASVGVTASRHPFVIRSERAGGGRRTAAPQAGNTPTLDAFEFPGKTPTGKAVTPKITDSMAVDDLPKMKGAMVYRDAKGVLKMFQDYTKQRTDQGLNSGDLGNETAFEQEHGDSVGPKAIQKLKNTVVPTTTPTPAKVGSFFTRKVSGWRWDDHLAGYIAKEARPFTCSCGNQIPTPSYGTCRCGKLWNSYAIGDGNHLANNSADMFITREIPIRDDVIMANRRMAGDYTTYDSGLMGGWEGMTALDREELEAQYNNPEKWRNRGRHPLDFGGTTVGDMLSKQAADDTDWVEDEDREDAEGPHAPGQTASRRQACWPGCHEDEAHAAKFHGGDGDAEKSAAVHLARDAARYLVAGLVGEPVSHVSDPSIQGVVTHADPNTGTAWVQHPGGHHEFPLHELQSTSPAPGPSLKDKVRNHVQQFIQNRPTNGGFAGGRSANAFFASWSDEDSDGWTKYDSPDPARAGGPKKPPSTTVKGGDPKWHSREPEGKFKSTTPFKGK